MTRIMRQIVVFMLLPDSTDTNVSARQAESTPLETGRHPSPPASQRAGVVNLKPSSQPDLRQLISANEGHPVPTISVKLP